MKLFIIKSLLLYLFLLSDNSRGVYKHLKWEKILNIVKDIQMFRQFNTVFCKVMSFWKGKQLTPIVFKHFF